MHRNKQKLPQSHKTLCNEHRITRPAFLSVKRDYIQYTSIDPGVKNLAIVIERHYFDHSNKRMIIVPIMWKLVGYDEMVEDVCYLFDRLIESLSSYILNSDYIIIERQMPWNYWPIRMSQLCICAILRQILDHNPDHEIKIIEISSKLKTKHLNAPKGMNEGATKKWSVGYYMEFLLNHGGYAQYYYLTTLKKQNDMTDAGNQIQAFIVEKKITEYKDVLYDENHIDSCFRGLPVSKDHYESFEQLKQFFHPPMPIFNIVSGNSFQPILNITSTSQPVFNISSNNKTNNTNNNNNNNNQKENTIVNSFNVMPVFNIQSTQSIQPVFKLQ
jgi:hypothetical protein